MGKHKTTTLQMETNTRLGNRFANNRTETYANTKSIDVKLKETWKHIQQPMLGLMLDHQVELG